MFNVHKSCFPSSSRCCVSVLFDLKILCNYFAVKDSLSLRSMVQWASLFKVVYLLVDILLKYKSCEVLIDM